MKDTEYHRPPEHWPQPPDESGTLAQTVQAVTLKKPKKPAADRKKRKKLSESLAGVTAAAVTVVMVANALPGLFPDMPVIAEPIPAAVCTVCERPDCPYYREGYGPGLRIALEDRPTYSDREDIYDMPGFSQENQIYRDVTSCIFTAEGQRLTFRVSSEIENVIPHINRTGGVLENTELYDPGQLAYTGFFARMDNAGAECEDCFLYGALVYAPDGNIPEPTAYNLDLQWYDFDYCNPNVYSATRSIPGLPKAQLQLVTDLPGAHLEAILDCFEVVQVQAEPLSFSLGETMRFTESDMLCRTYEDAEFWGSLMDFGFQTDHGEEFHFMETDFAQKCYLIRHEQRGDYEINFAAAGWPKVIQTWRALNAEAPNYGHTVDYPVAKLQDIQVNGITYRCYAIYSALPVDDINNHRWVWYYYIPTQEETVAIVDHTGLSEEELQYMLERQEVPHREFFLEEVLSCITLR